MEMYGNREGHDIYLTLAGSEHVLVSREHVHATRFHIGGKLTVIVSVDHHRGSETPQTELFHHLNAVQVRARVSSSADDAKTYHISPQSFTGQTDDCAIPAECNTRSQTSQLFLFQAVCRYNWGRWTCISRVALAGAASGGQERAELAELVGALAEDLTAFLAEHRTLWLARNRIGGPEKGSNAHFSGMIATHRYHPGVAGLHRNERRTRLDRTAKVLVVYYSLTGNTRLIAQAVAHKVGADLLEIRTARDPISKLGFLRFPVSGFQALFRLAPRLRPVEVAPNEYDLLFIGTPVWAGGYAPAIRTFLSRFTLEGKKIALFCCCAVYAGRALDRLSSALARNEIVGRERFVTLVKETRKHMTQRAADWAAQIVARSA